jgi:porphobilinogen synthase
VNVTSGSRVSATATGGLRGRAVVNTRAPRQAAELDSLLESHGARPLTYPCIDVRLPGVVTALDAGIRTAAAGQFDWLLLTSSNTVTSLARRLAALGLPADALAGAGLRVGVVGPATAEAALTLLGLSAEIRPARAAGADLAAALPDAAGKRVFLPQSETAPPDLRLALEARGARVTVAPAYRTVIGCGGVDLPELLSRGAVDAIVVTSPSAVRNLLVRLGGAGLGVLDLQDVPVACLGRTTAGAATEAGLAVAVCPEAQTLPALVDSLDVYFSGGTMTFDLASIPTRAAACWGSSASPVVRPRRLRLSGALRSAVRETSLSAEDLVYPLFIHHDADGPRPIEAMPGQFQWSLDAVVDEARRARDLGIRTLLLFGLPAHKDATGSENYDPQGVVPLAIRAIKAALPDVLVVSDMCFCEYTDHGHCGVVNSPGSPEYREELPAGYLLNEPTLELLGEASIVHARAGADVIAPSGMLDGMIGAIRRALDGAGLEHTVVMSYAAKYASGYYGPFREAAGAMPQFGDRAQYQMDPANRREALKEVAIDVAEGADIVMVKPALPYLDVLAAVRERVDVPVAAYQVSGEYSMLCAAAANGWLDRRRCMLEALTCIKRAGADLIITYAATEAAAWLD